VATIVSSQESSTAIVSGRHASNQRTVASFKAPCTLVAKDEKTMPSLHRIPDQLDLRRQHSEADKSHGSAFSVAAISTGRRPVPARLRPTPYVTTRRQARQ
jgi:hypothetical protein